MAITISQLEAQSLGKLPSQSIVNPRENASVIVLRNGEEVEIPVKITPIPSDQENEKNVTSDSSIPVDKRDVPDSDNILKYAIKQVPRYAKFLKKLCTIKRKQKLKGCEKVIMGENVYTIIQRKLPAKYKDPGTFTIPCMIGNTRFEKVMLDLRASINVMPYSIYVSLKLRPLNETGVVIQLVNRSNAYPKSVVEDVFVQINNLVFSTDFYVLDMKNNDQTAPILLGRPFLKTSMTKIDVYTGTLAMEFDGEIVKFNIYNAMKYFVDDNPVYSIDVIDSLAHEIFELNRKDELEVVLSKHLKKENEKLALSIDL
ncbi:uncharacterized protein LOC123215307 [Mangifera indica]|uniref:uncharacterized protein LOC123215307 n=1 Tax=Mangifera indica TaxID=29780 RepID=UPI001CF9F549|nr:uncharacterized protein LOC123215307 [Mangifera indica]